MTDSDRCRTRGYHEFVMGYADCRVCGEPGKDGPLVVQMGASTADLIPCPCGCRLLTQAPGVQRCGCCDTEQATAHWDGLYGVCDGCAWCHSLGEGECHHGECYEPIHAARERTVAVIAQRAGP